MLCLNSDGPTFGAGFDLHIAHNAHQNTNSYSHFPHSYGQVDSETPLLSSLAGKSSFCVMELEVFTPVVEEDRALTPRVDSALADIAVK